MRILGWFAGFRSRPVVLSSPHPPSECLQQLATVTAERGYSWFLASENIGRPDPRFRGQIGPSRILVARFEDSLRQNSFVPWLHLIPEPSADGGTILAGTIGLRSDARVVILMTTGLASLISLSMLAAVVVSGQLSGAPFILISLAMVAVSVGFDIAGPRSLEREIPKLIGEVNELLDSVHGDAAS